MILEELRLQNFRCFGESETRLRFSTDLVAFIGANGSGKTAILLALCRLFGTNRKYCSIVRQDFHVSYDEGEEKMNHDLALEAIFSFPELCEDEVDNNFYAVPSFLSQMMIKSSNEAPRIRIRLQATWTDDGTSDGHVAEDVRWLDTLDGNDNWDDCRIVHPIARKSIQFIFIPVERSVDAAVLNLLKGRLWKAAQWSESFRTQVSDSISDIQDAFMEELPTKFVTKHLNESWRHVNTAETDTTAVLRLIDPSFDSIVNNATFAFSPERDEPVRQLNDLSDGQRSLFYLSLTSATLKMEMDAMHLSSDECPFETDEIGKFYFTIFSIEEPENSLSPFLLSRAIQEARHIASLNNAQVIITSHSPSILGRVEVEEVRYFRFDELSQDATIDEIDLPIDIDDAQKFIRLAVKSYPELYFARFVILCEGESEQIIIHKMAQAMGIDLDRNFVPIVPLAGRFVKQFWKLLTMLKIPHATLLDYDKGRSGGGAERIKYIVDELTEHGILDKNDKFAKWVYNNYDNEEKVEKHQQQVFDQLNKYGVYFAEPLDIDFSMLLSFEELYMVPIGNERGPRLEEDAVNGSKSEVLGGEGNPSCYTEEYNEIFPWYRYLFIARSKPQSHILRLAKLSSEEIVEKCPDVLRKIIDDMSMRIGKELSAGD